MARDITITNEGSDGGASLSQLDAAWEQMRTACRKGGRPFVCKLTRDATGIASMVLRVLPSPAEVARPDDVIQRSALLEFKTPDDKDFSVTIRVDDPKIMPPIEEAVKEAIQQKMVEARATAAQYIKTALDSPRTWESDLVLEPVQKEAVNSVPPPPAPESVVAAERIEEVHDAPQGRQP